MTRNESNAESLFVCGLFFALVALLGWVCVGANKDHSVKHAEVQK